MARAAYAAWKRGILSTALGQAARRAPVEPLVDAHGAGRRRVTLHARFGWRDPRSATWRRAATTSSRSPSARSPSRRCARRRRAALALGAPLAAARKPLDLQVTATETGLDVDLRGHGAHAMRERLGLTEAAGRARPRPTVRARRRRGRAPPPTIAADRRGRAAARLVPAGDAAGEEMLAGLVLEACAQARSGSPTCSPAAVRSRCVSPSAREVHAVDGDSAALAALDRAARANAGPAPRDDGDARPVPPSAAAAGARALRRRRDRPAARRRRSAGPAACRRRCRSWSSVSCDAGTFARDAAILIEGGYRLERVTPVDQFKYSPHLEIVGVFRRDPRPPRRR